MPESNKKKQEDLKMLRRFCAQTKIWGWCSNMWFNGLLCRYPLHFLFYTQYSTSFKGGKEMARKSVQDKFQFRLERLLKLGIQECDINIIEKMMDKLDTLIDEKNKQISN